MKSIITRLRKIKQKLANVSKLQVVTGFGIVIVGAMAGLSGFLIFSENGSRLVSDILPGSFVSESGVDEFGTTDNQEYSSPNADGSADSGDSDEGGGNDQDGGDGESDNSDSGDAESSSADGSESSDSGDTESDGDNSSSGDSSSNDADNGGSDGDNPDDSSSDGLGGSDAYVFDGKVSGTVTIPAGFPNPDTTGLAAVGIDPGSLQEYGGPYTISSGTHTIERKKLTQRLTVRDSAHVTVRESLVKHTGLYGLYNKFSNPGTLVVEDSDVRVAGGGSKAIVGSNITVRRSDVRYGDDNLHISGDNVVVRNSFLVDSGYPGSEGGHYDAIQTVGGDGLTIRGSTVLGRWQAQTSALILQAARRALTNVTLDSNFLSGGNYTLYIRNKSDQPAPSNITVTDNVWNPNSWQFGPTSLDCGSSWTWSGNTDTDGNTISGC